MPLHSSIDPHSSDFARNAETMRVLVAELREKLDQAASILDLAVENCRPSRFEEPLFFSAMTYYSLGDKEKTKARLEDVETSWKVSK